MKGRKREAFIERLQINLTLSMMDELKEASIYYNKPMSFLAREGIEELLAEYRILKQLGETHYEEFKI